MTDEVRDVIARALYNKAVAELDALADATPHDKWENARPEGKKNCYSAADAILTALREGGWAVVRTEPSRCPICSWPFAESREKGCVPGDCSYRPEPGSAEHQRIKRNRAMIARSEG